MINEKTIADFMNSSSTSLEDFSKFINKLIKEHGREKIIATAGIDKNVLYRASNSQNITLENYYKIKQAYSTKLVEKTTHNEIKDLPIYGQIIENSKVRTLNPTQPSSMPVPHDFITAWSPVFGYLCVSGTAYTGSVFIFSGKYIEDKKNSISKKCVNRLIMAYFEDGDPVYGMILEQVDEFILIHPTTREVLKKIPFKNNVSWSKFIALVPFSLMENYEEPKYHDNIHKLEDSFHDDCGTRHKHSD
tara:strand:- start:496 stop:1236 length:741 start_codon:yes stop_codon:yes gene_type:complete